MPDAYDSRFDAEYMAAMGEEMNRRLGSKRQFVMTMEFDDMLLEIERPDQKEMLERLYMFITEKLVAKLREEGYLEGSYRVEYLVERRAERNTSRISVRAVVDESKRGMTGWAPMDSSIVRAAMGPPRGVVYYGEPVVGPQSPVVDGTMEQTLKIRRTIKITEV